MFFDILTLFPKMFESVFADSIILRAIEKNIVSVTLDDIRSYTTDRHHTVDDYPYGGDPGMLMKPEPVSAAIKAAIKRHENKNPVTVYLSPRGQLFNHEMAEKLSKSDGLILLCGRYKGVDQRVIDRYADCEVSVGDYVLSGGELAAMVIVDAVTRLLPGALGNEESAGDDSLYNGLLSPPVYTRPELFEDMKVPGVLLSGNHARIRAWKADMSRETTVKQRPDLWDKFNRLLNPPVS
jgi:tRNA (guanine37-N1)-methyltransferase